MNKFSIDAENYLGRGNVSFVLLKFADSHFLFPFF